MKLIVLLQQTDECDNNAAHYLSFHHVAAIWLTLSEHELKCEM